MPTQETHGSPASPDIVNVVVVPTASQSFTRDSLSLARMDESVETEATQQPSSSYEVRPVAHDPSKWQQAAFLERRDERQKYQATSLKRKQNPGHVPAQNDQDKVTPATGVGRDLEPSVQAKKVKTTHDIDDSRHEHQAQPVDRSVKKTCEVGDMVTETRGKGTSGQIIVDTEIQPCGSEANSLHEHSDLSRDAESSSRLSLPTVKPIAHKKPTSQWTSTIQATDIRKQVTGHERLLLTLGELRKILSKDSG